MISLTSYYRCHWHRVRRGASFQIRSIKLNVSLRASVAVNRYIKITKFFENYNSTQSPSVDDLAGYRV